jgi:hypothetical protein
LQTAPPPEARKALAPKPEGKPSERRGEMKDEEEEKSRKQ